MHDTYVVLIVLASIILGFITSARIGMVLIKRWDIGGGSEHGFFSFVCGACAAVMMGFMTSAAVQLFGLFGGLLGVALTVPVVGFCWIFLVGGNMALERILQRLVKRID